MTLEVPTKISEKGKVVDKYTSAAQVAKRFRVTPRTVVRWIADGEFPGAFQVNPEVKNSPFLIPVAAVEAYALRKQQEDANGSSAHEN